jgi:hypothetical protein
MEAEKYQTNVDTDIIRFFTIKVSFFEQIKYGAKNVSTLPAKKWGSSMGTTFHFSVGKIAEKFA